MSGSFSFLHRAPACPSGGLLLDLVMPLSTRRKSPRRQGTVPMKLRNPWVLCLLGLLGAWLIRVWMGTLRYRLFFADGIRHPEDSRNHRCIYAFWHESILFPAAFRSRIHVLI